MLKLLALAATRTDGATDLGTWEGVLNRWGLPLLLLFVFGVAAWKFARWAAPLMTQLIQRIIKFFDTLDERLDRIEADTKESKRTNAETLQAMQDVLKEVLKHKRGGS